MQNSMAKVDAVIKENPDTSLDELVEARKINADQKAQALKKPQLQSQLGQLEEQLSTFRRLEVEHQAQLAREKEQLVVAHAAELEAARREARNKGLAEAKVEALSRERDRLLLFTRFLAAAAMRRNREDQETPENRAFEGALLLVYGGNAVSVIAAQKIIDGSNDKLVGIDDVVTDITCKFAIIRKRQITDAWQTAVSASWCWRRPPPWLTRGPSQQPRERKRPPAASTAARPSLTVSRRSRSTRPRPRSPMPMQALLLRSLRPATSRHSRRATSSSHARPRPRRPLPRPRRQ
jgi:hypothetical protein